MKISKNITSAMGTPLIEVEYNKLVRKLNPVMGTIRLPLVRKFLKFSPLTYSDYGKIKTQEESIFSHDFSIMIPDIIFECNFNSSFFPQLEQETTVLYQNIIGKNESAYDIPFDFDSPYADWQKLEEYMYPSITMYHHQLRQAVSKSLECEKPFGKEGIVEFAVSSIWKPWACSSFHEIKTLVNFGVIL